MTYKLYLAHLVLCASALAPNLRAQAVAPAPVQQFQYFDNNGKPLAGGKVCSYAAGTTTPLVTYGNSAATPNTNPVILDSAGRAGIWLGPAAYKIVLRTAGTDNTCATGTIIFSVDGIFEPGQKLRTDLAATTGAALVGYAPPGGTATTVAAALNATTLLDLGYASFSAACAAATGAGKTLAITQHWTVSASFTCASDLWVLQGAQITYSGTLVFSGTIDAQPIKWLVKSGSGALTFSGRLREIYAEWWGAIPDGSTDNTVALNIAIATASSTTGSAVPLQLLGGVYAANTATAAKVLILPVPACNGSDHNNPCGVVIRGLGSAYTVISTTATAADLMSADMVDASSFGYTLTGFRLVGPDTSGATATSGNGLYLSGNPALTALPVFCRIHDVHANWFRGSGKAGIWFDGMEFATVQDVQAQHNDIGLKLTGATNAVVFDDIEVSYNATYGATMDDITSDTFNSFTAEGNEKTGLLITQASGLVFNACHFEVNNQSATAGIQTLNLQASAGKSISYIDFVGCSFSGAHEQIGLNGFGGSGSLAQVRFTGGQNFVTGGLVVSNGGYGSALFDGSVSRGDITDPAFAVTVVNAPDGAVDTYPNGAGTGYVNGSRVYSATTNALTPGSIASGTCYEVLVSAAGNLATGSLVGARSTHAAVASTNSAYGSTQLVIKTYPTTNGVYLDICNPTAGAITPPAAQAFSIRVFP